MGFNASGTDLLSKLLGEAPTLNNTAMDGIDFNKSGANLFNTNSQDGRSSSYISASVAGGGEPAPG